MWNWPTYRKSNQSNSGGNFYGTSFSINDNYILERIHFWARYVDVVFCIWFGTCLTPLAICGIVWLLLPESCLLSILPWITSCSKQYFSCFIICPRYSFFRRSIVQAISFSFPILCMTSMMVMWSFQDIRRMLRYVHISNVF